MDFQARQASWFARTREVKSETRQPAWAFATLGSPAALPDVRLHPIRVRAHASTIFHHFGSERSSIDGSPRCVGQL